MHLFQVIFSVCLGVFVIFDGSGLGVADQLLYPERSLLNSIVSDSFSGIVLITCTSKHTITYSVCLINKKKRTRAFLFVLVITFDNLLKPSALCHHMDRLHLFDAKHRSSWSRGKQA